MVNVNMNAPAEGGGGPIVPGIDLWEVTKAEDGHAKSGDPKISIKMERVEGSGFLYDTIMLAGGGWGIGKRKLVALGIPADFDGDLDPLDLMHRRVWVSTGIETYNGKDRLKVMIDDLKYAGMQAAADVPPGKTLPDEPDPAPF